MPFGGLRIKKYPAAICCMPMALTCSKKVITGLEKEGKPHVCAKISKSDAEQLIGMTS